MKSFSPALLLLAAVTLSGCLDGVHAKSRVKTSLSEDLACSACVHVLDVIVDKLMETSGSTAAIEVGSSLNDKSNYKTVKYARSEVRIMEVLESACDELPRLGIDTEYGIRQFVSMDLPADELDEYNVTKHNPYRKTVRNTCYTLLEEYDEELSGLLYKRFDDIESGELEAAAYVCNEVAEMCDSSEAGVARREQQRKDGMEAHFQWLLAQAESDVNNALADLSKKKNTLKIHNATLESLQGEMSEEESALEAAKAEAEKANSTLEQVTKETKEKQGWFSSDGLSAEAQATVDALEAQLAELNTQLEEASSLTDKLSEKVESFNAIEETSNDDLKKAEKKAKRAHKNVERKEAALKQAQLELEKAVQDAELADQEAAYARESADAAVELSGKSVLELEEAKEKRKAMLESVAAKQKEIAEAKATPLSRAQEEAEAATAAVADLEVSLTQKLVKIEDAKGRVEGGEEQVAKASEKLKELEDMLDYAREAYEAFSNGLPPPPRKDKDEL